ncbi:hypothetical protein PC118_g11249 [Phytophthora cactorum]|uniref:C2H2-type domain-containing protein n=1 Tax=Phytophthora cactorum TaxID=29920 RepID=A0A8T1FQ30_9STRA|nr:hypothetical protein PC111_g11389 [Phytophthora cactorum]KAG2980314.1 hypothetical protein PC118_g11249 [Phytophthora cactorum]KAG3163952.1 hypothetical protein C6341_g12803 [Phytophthora cactorum]
MCPKFAPTLFSRTTQHASNKNIRKRVPTAFLCQNLCCGKHFQHFKLAAHHSARHRLLKRILCAPDVKLVTSVGKKRGHLQSVKCFLKCFANMARVIIQWQV